MAQVEDHLLQVKRNFKFLESVNEKIEDSCDWQVTVCFYTAVHLVNSHLAQSSSQYRSHTQVKHALNPEVKTSLTKLPEDEYFSYVALQTLSRRSRYLVNEKDGNIGSTSAALTYDKHLAKSIRHLDRLFVYFCSKYSITMPQIRIKCISLRTSEDLKYFIVQ